MDNLIDFLETQFTLVAVIDQVGNNVIVETNNYLPWAICNTTSEFIDKFKTNVHFADRDNLTNFLDLEKVTHSLQSTECRFKVNEDEYKWFRLNLVLSSELAKIYFSCAETTRSHEIEIQRNQEEYKCLFTESITDEQTKFYNRKGLEFFKPKILDEVQRDEDKRLLVSVFDLNSLKYINDTFGHSAGDLAIKKCCHVIKSVMPSHSYLIRTGGDEFLALTVLHEDSSWFKTLDKRLNEMFDAINKISKLPYEIRASYGSIESSANSQTIDIDRYIEEADALMYCMKKKTDKYRR